MTRNQSQHDRTGSCGELYELRWPRQRERERVVWERSVCCCAGRCQKHTFGAHLWSARFCANGVCESQNKNNNAGRSSSSWQVCRLKGGCACAIKDHTGRGVAACMLRLCRRLGISGLRGPRQIWRQVEDDAQAGPPGEHHFAHTLFAVSTPRGALCRSMEPRFRRGHVTARHGR